MNFAGMLECKKSIVDLRSAERAYDPWWICVLLWVSMEFEKGQAVETSLERETDP